MITPNNPPYPAYRATDKESFAYDTTIRRWPIIIDSAIKDVEQSLSQSSGDALKEGQDIIKGLELIKTELLEDTKLRPIQDNKVDTAQWNQHLIDYFPDASWFTGTWLFNECYLYRRIAELFHNTSHWTHHDVFERQKIQTFHGSSKAVLELAQQLPLDPDLAYQELIQICLWGNATDLSLLTHMSTDDIQRLQAIDALNERRAYILVDHIDTIWSHLGPIRDGRIDFVLDNSGFELYVDMILADWLVQTGRARSIVFHCKTLPWFVSDVMPKDIPDLVHRQLDLFGSDQVRVLKDRWAGYLDAGIWSVESHGFWCTGLSYWYLKSEAPDLYHHLKASDLIFFKGDLNFRKLVFDCDWPVTTPFRDAIGPDLAQDFTAIVSLRTNKADPIVGLSEETKSMIEAKTTKEDWRFSGKYAVVEFNK